MLQPDMSLNLTPAAVGMGNVTKMNAEQVLGNLDPIPDRLVVLFPLSQQQMRLSDICHVSVYRKPHPHIDIRDETIGGIVKSAALMSDPSHQSECTDGTMWSTEHERKPLKSLCEF
jgi:hypothetical protein